MKTRLTALPKLFIGIDIHKRSWKEHLSTDLFAVKSFTMPRTLRNYRNRFKKHFLETTRCSLLMKPVVVVVLPTVALIIMAGRLLLLPGVIIYNCLLGINLESK